MEAFQSTTKYYSQSSCKIYGPQQCPSPVTLVKVLKSKANFNTGMESFGVGKPVIDTMKSHYGEEICRFEDHYYVCF